MKTILISLILSTALIITASSPLDEQLAKTNIWNAWKIQHKKLYSNTTHSEKRYFDNIHTNSLS